MADCANYKSLIMGLMDNELTAEETADVNQHLIRCKSCRKEFDELSKSCSRLKAVSFSGPSDDDLERIWKQPFSRFTRNMGLLTVITGWMVLIIYSIIEFIKSETEPLLPKIATVGIIIGFIIILISALSDRLKTIKTDPYREIKR